MAYIKLPSTLSWSNIYTLSGVTVGKSLIVTNYWTQAIRIIESATQPTIDAIGYPVMPGLTVSLSYKGLPFWVKGEDGYIAVDEINKQSIEPYAGGVDLPNDLWTSDTEGLRRLRVDVGQTSFFSGTEFRTFREFTVTAGETLVMKAVVSGNIFLHQAETVIDEGLLRLTVANGGTEGGVFSDAWSIIPKNSTTNAPVNTSTVNISSGGTHTGGTTLDIIRIASESLGGRRASVVSTQEEVRGIPPNTYYYKFNNIGNTTVNATFHGWWEQR